MLDLDTIVAHVVDAVSANEAIDPVAVRFLLSEYAATGREDLAAVVGEALARALEQHVASAAHDRAEWLLLFADAAEWSDDERIGDATRQLLGASAASAPDVVEATLRASMTIGDRARVSSAVDDLERLVGRGYEPGDGVAAADQVAVASALLTAFDITGRLPYAMLAEELLHAVHRRGETGGSAERACRAAHALCRLAALHADEEYLRAAVVAPHADYAADGARLLDEHGGRALDEVRVAALYGLALARWLGLH